jgi:hypothetical protein
MSAPLPVIVELNYDGHDIGIAVLASVNKGNIEVTLDPDQGGNPDKLLKVLQSNPAAVLKQVNAALVKANYKGVEPHAELVDVKAGKPVMGDAQIKYMVDRFLGWRLPENFNPDGGISFKPDYNEHTAYPAKHEPIGTNLFDAMQAEQMVRYLVDGIDGAMPEKESNDI